MPTPFDFLKTITETKKDLMEEDENAIKDYNAFIVNRGLSQTADTVLLANEMNVRHGVPAEAHYRFLLNSVDKRKRYAKWAKKTDSEAIKAIQEAFGYSFTKAEAALMILDDEKIEQLKRRNSKGGRKA